MKLFAAVLLGLFLHAPGVAGPMPTVELLWNGKVTPFYTYTQDSLKQESMEEFSGAELADRMAKFAQGFRLRHDLSVGFTSCDTPNAYYDPRSQMVVMCTEFVDQVLEVLKADRQIMAQLDKHHQMIWVRGVLWGVFLHELGHAIIHINGVPYTGRQEDVADQFAFWFAANHIPAQVQPIVVPTIWFWQALARKHDLAALPSDSLRRMLADEHSLDLQRTYNVTCWFLGANPSGAVSTAKFVGLSDARAVRCPEEYASLNNAMRSQFSKYIRGASTR